MTFTESVKSGFENYATFRGRASRSEYWWWVLFFWSSSFLITYIAGFLFGSVGGILAVIFFLAMLIPSWTMIVRRLHDCDKSGWWLLIVFLPFLGPFILTMWLLMPGTPRPNTYGVEEDCTPPERLNIFAYIFASLSFTFFLGLLASILTFLIGIFSSKEEGRNVVVIGVLGLIFQGFFVGTVGGLLYAAYMSPGKVGERLRLEMTRQSLAKNVLALEDYKKAYGQYPKSLGEVIMRSPHGRNISLNDPASVAPGYLKADQVQLEAGDKPKPEPYYYESDGVTYTLLAVGPDKKPFTDDDVKLESQ